MLSHVSGRPAPRVRLPHAVALAAGYADAAISRLLGREPQIPLEGVRMARHSMFVATEKARRELGFAPGPVAAALERAVRWYQDNGYVRVGVARRYRGSTRGLSEGNTRQGKSQGRMKILVTFAVGTEFAAWRQQHDFRQVARDPFPLYVAEIGGSTVRVLLTGIGTDAAAQAMRWALASPADLCISSGFVGALSPAISRRRSSGARVVRRAERELAVASDRELLARPRRRCPPGGPFLDHRTSGRERRAENGSCSMRPTPSRWKAS